jgi:hypothetical protein
MARPNHHERFLDWLLASGFLRGTFTINFRNCAVELFAVPKLRIKKEQNKAEDKNKKLKNIPKLPPLPPSTKKGMTEKNNTKIKD